MILLALALGVASVPTPATLDLTKKAATPAAAPRTKADAANEGELRAKMASWRGHWIVEDKGIGCKTTTSSGDPRIDAVGCRAIQLCIGSKFKDIMAIGDSKVSDEEKKRQAAAIIDGQQTCIAKNRSDAIAVLANPARMKESGR